MNEPRVTLAVAQLLREFMLDPLRPRHGYDLMKSTGFPSGKLYPILIKFKAAGLMTDELEQGDPSVEGRPLRKLYRLSPGGVAFAQRALEEVAATTSLPRTAPRPQTETSSGGMA